MSILLWLKLFDGLSCGCLLLSAAEAISRGYIPTIRYIVRPAISNEEYYGK